MKFTVTHDSNGRVVALFVQTPGGDVTVTQTGLTVWRGTESAAGPWPLSVTSHSLRIELPAPEPINAMPRTADDRRG